MTGQLQRLIEKTPFADKAKCIADVLARAGLARGTSWENAPVKIGGRICGEDVYRVTSALYDAYHATAEDVPDIEEVTVEEPEPEIDGNSIFVLTHKGLSQAQAQALASAGFMTLDQLREYEADQLPEVLQGIEGIGEKTAERIIRAL